MTSGIGWADRRCSASLAFSASVTSQPAWARVSAIDHRISDSSSTIKTCSFGDFSTTVANFSTPRPSWHSDPLSVYAKFSRTTLCVLFAVQDQDQSAGIGFARAFRVLHLELVGPPPP